jgi:hypothetical protein
MKETVLCVVVFLASAAAIRADEPAAPKGHPDSSKSTSLRTCCNWKSATQSVQVDCCVKLPQPARLRKK